MGWAENVVGAYFLEYCWPVTAQIIKEEYEPPWYAFVIPLVPVALAWIGLKWSWGWVIDKVGVARNGDP